MSLAREGWYPDPSGDASRKRYWDGEKWTDRYQEARGFEQRHESEGPETPDPAIMKTTSTPSSQDSTLRLVAFVFCIISTVGSGVFLIPLAWMIPMSVRAWGIYKGVKPNTVAFGVCTLLFVSLVAGILLLCSDKDE